MRNAAPPSSPRSHGRGRSRRVSISAQNVRPIATISAVCQTPPRSVMFQSTVPNPNSTVSQPRSSQRRTPNAPSIDQASATSTPARNALMRGSQAIAWPTPMSATSGMNRNAGNGANGT